MLALAVTVLAVTVPAVIVSVAWYEWVPPRDEDRDCEAAGGCREGLDRTFHEALYSPV